MAGKHAEALRKARESFVRKRRAMAEQTALTGAASAHFAPAFADLQAVGRLPIERTTRSPPSGLARTDHFR